ncbi:hypothetical protein JR316_0005173 [Psilocybe cubensis]|uniref:Uncharacterized protein n=1 Tax=Psilocybe cubensis TaxID=181762 RepID=A0ACB8H5M0_PSICU|nr:hypothetical protein JR316_0005173 [Psilocybe cubensis]KAH9483073.1 hypothetical protein JR316_0005173 [Psilocybe cubensis]
MPIPQSAQHQLWVVQATIDSLVESTLLQSFTTGIYALLFLQAIGPSVKQKKRIVSGTLSTLFVVIVINLAAAWSTCRSVVVVHDTSRESMAQDLFTGPESTMQKVAYGTLAISVIIADTFMVWRCYMLWQTKLILAVYGLVLVGEIIILPIFLVLHITLGSRFGFLDLYFILSLCTTITTSGLIIYRIVDVSSRGNNDISRYHYTIKILVESGLLYTAVILICGVTHLMLDFGVVTPGVIQAVQDFDAILVPVTGIAPTLIASRNATKREEKREKENRSTSQMISQLNFHRDESRADRSQSTQSENFETSQTTPGASRQWQWQARTV